MNHDKLIKLYKKNLSKRRIEQARSKHPELTKHSELIENQLTEIQAEPRGGKTQLILCPKCHLVSKRSSRNYICHRCGWDLDSSLLMEKTE